MSKSNMKREQDDAAEIADLVAGLKVVMTEALHRNEEFVVTTSTGALTYNFENVFNESLLIDSKGFMKAAVSASDDSAKAVDELAWFKEKAIARIVNQAPLAAMAMHQVKTREAA